MLRSAAILLILTLRISAQSSEEKEIPKQNPYQSESDVSRGKQLFLGHCAPCHGPTGNGGKGANLARPTLQRATDDPALFRIIRDGVPGTEMPGAWEMIDHEIWQVSAFVQTLGRVPMEMTSGNRDHGEQLFQTKGKCLQCHTVSSAGGRMGPVLTEVGYRRTATFLRNTLIDPQATIPDGYVFLELVTKDKQRISGIRLNEDTYTIQLRDFSDRLYSFWKSDLLELRKDRTHTPMPSVRSTFSDAEIEDVIAYLLSLRGPQ